MAITVWFYAPSANRINHDGERFGISLTDAKLPAGDTVLYTAEANPVYLRAGRAALPMHYAPFKPDYVFPLEVGRQIGRAHV